VTFWIAITTSNQLIFAADQKFSGDAGWWLERKIQRVGDLVMCGAGSEVMLRGLALMPHVLSGVAQQDSDAEVRAGLDAVGALLAAEYGYYNAVVANRTPVRGRIFLPHDTRTMLVVAGLDARGVPFIARGDSPAFRFQLYGPWHCATAPARIGLDGVPRPIQMPAARQVSVDWADYFSRRAIDVIRDVANANPEQVSPSADLWVIGPSGIVTKSFDDAGELVAEWRGACMSDFEEPDATTGGQVTATRRTPTFERSATT